MSGIRIETFVVALACAALAGCGKPDLRIKEAKVRMHTDRGLRYSVVVENYNYGGSFLTGPRSARPPIMVTARGPGGEEWGSVVIQKEYLPTRTLRPAETFEARFEYIAGGFDPRGAAEVVFTIDPANLVAEKDETNNTARAAIPPRE